MATGERRHWQQSSRVKTEQLGHKSYFQSFSGEGGGKSDEGWEYRKGQEHKQDPCYEGKDLQHTLLLSFHSSFLGMVSQASMAIFLFMFPMFSACLLLY